MTSAAGEAVLIDYDEGSDGGLDVTFASRGDHDLNLTAGAVTAAMRWVCMPNLSTGQVPWPAMAEWLFSFGVCDDSVRELAPMRRYVQGAAWDRCSAPLSRVLGPGGSRAAAKLTTRGLEVAIRLRE